MFNKRKSIEQVEESNEFAPKFDQNGLIVVTTVDASNDKILMTGLYEPRSFRENY
jgi:phosphoribosyl-AMP cyclohydrolase